MKTDAFISELKSKIKKEYRVLDEDILVEWHDDSLENKTEEVKKIYPGKDISFDVKELLIKNIAGKLSIPVDVLVDGKPNRILFVKCKVDILKQVLVAVDLIKKGEEFTESNIVYSKVSLSKIHKNFVPAEQKDTLGKVASADITKNSVITSNLLKEKVVIFKGNQVTIRLINGELTLTGSGIAMADGYLGQSIQVKVTSFSSKKTLNAKVIGTDFVEINLGGIEN